MPVIRLTSNLSTKTSKCHESNVAQILGITCGLAALAVMTVCLRTYVRVYLLNQFGADDWVMLFALSMAVGTVICFIGEVVYGGIGRHSHCITPLQTERFMEWTYFHSIWVMIGVVLVKVSVALFLMRLVLNKTWKRWLWSAIVFLVCFCLSCAGTLIFSCWPVEASWNLALREGPGTRCFSAATYSRIGLFNSIINILTDFIFALLPVPVILKLQTNRRTKVALMLILGLGLLACAAGIVKVRIQAVFPSLKDFMWDDSFNVWNMIELCLGIIAASLPSLRPLFSQLQKSIRSAWSRSGLSSRQRCIQTFEDTRRSNRHINTACADGLADFDKAFKANVMTASHDFDAITRQDLAYDVHVHGGEDDGWGRSGTMVLETEERLGTYDGITKMTEVFRRSEPRVV